MVIFIHFKTYDLLTLHYHSQNIVGCQIGLKIEWQAENEENNFIKTILNYLFHHSSMAKLIPIIQNTLCNLLIPTW